MNTTASTLPQNHSLEQRLGGEDLSSKMNEQYKSSFEQDQGGSLGVEVGRGGVSENIAKLPVTIFSSAFGIIRWFIGLRWYVILLIIVFGSFLFMQIESAFETRRAMQKLKKEGKQEGMHNNNNNTREDDKIQKIKGILRQTDNAESIGNMSGQKNVSFISDATGKSEATGKSQEAFEGQEYSFVNDLQLKWKETTSCIYKLWIMPWMYALFRHIGLVR